jgi:UDP-2-acetamido-3-amino-2,3-dideoxy-glucuronate N-acetyltransferase
MSYFVHESSYIDEGVKIGKNSKIWHFSHVMENSILGKNCSLGQNVHIGPNVTIGDNVKIQNNVSIYEGVTIEDDVFCGPSMVFTNIYTPRSAYPRDNSEYLKTLVKRGATIGANATIVCGITLGKSCFIGAGSVITKDVPDYAIMYGVPGKLKGWMCECGRKLDITEVDIVCNKCSQRYEFIDREMLRKKEDI